MTCYLQVRRVWKPIPVAQHEIAVFGTWQDARLTASVGAPQSEQVQNRNSPTVAVRSIVDLNETPDPEAFGLPLRNGKMESISRRSMSLRKHDASAADRQGLTRHEAGLIRKQE